MYEDNCHGIFRNDSLLCAKISWAGAGVNMLVHIFVKNDVRILFLEECALSRL